MRNSVFIIGEIGINHNGDMEICKKIINMVSNEANSEGIKYIK